MPDPRMLLDSNAYFRLAQSIHPLLGVAFGEQGHTLVVLKELQEEYKKSPRLQSRFPWVSDPEYVANRSNLLVASKELKPEIKRAHDFILDYARNVHPGVSKVDVLALAHAEQLGIPVVTDDEEMRLLADDYGIATLKTLDVLKQMLIAGHITIEKVREIAAYWIYLRDCPRDFSHDYRALFGEDPPR